MGRLSTAIASCMRPSKSPGPPQVPRIPTPIQKALGNRRLLDGDQIVASRAWHYRLQPVVGHLDLVMLWRVRNLVLVGRQEFL